MGVNEEFMCVSGITVSKTLIEDREKVSILHFWLDTNSALI